MKAVIIEQKKYEELPSALCSAIWETFKKPDGAKLISRESGGVMDMFSMERRLHSVIKATLEKVSE